MIKKLACGFEDFLLEKLGYWPTVILGAITGGIIGGGIFSFIFALLQ